MSQVGIIAALPGELKPLTREWPRTDQVALGFVHNRECLAAAEGMGGAAAMRSFQAIRAAATDLRMLVSYGWAGALLPGLEPGTVHSVGEVVDARTGERFATASGSPTRLVTLGHVARRDEKMLLAERYAASLVDMEAATVARLARAHGLGFLCFRGISDSVDDDLPDFNRFTTHDGKLRTASLVLHAALRPGTWGPLAALGRNSAAAAQALAHQLPDELARARLVS